MDRFGVAKIVYFGDLGEIMGQFEIAVANEISCFWLFAVQIK